MYTDPSTGAQSRVFDALVSYPSEFTLKIIGSGETFVKDMLALLNEHSNGGVTESKVRRTANGKWESITATVMVDSGDMVYLLYEKIDEDPRVKFKF
ncbi:hypothetical protein TeGR_g9816 [Tetraparma gracilis]|uniref:Uncharacterized protein n=1 Tax=Tetraparma gracilis TaxID=2962635 RepID=A0ABQ6MD02_9STRA|nr:hypothetical protein TeGR_g9816 [Tetraparma gracilis]